MKRGLVLLLSLFFVCYFLGWFINVKKVFIFSENIIREPGEKHPGNNPTIENCKTGYTIKVLHFPKNFVILFRKIRLYYCITYIEKKEDFKNMQREFIACFAGES